MYRTSQVYSDAGNLRAWSTTKHLVTELADSLDVNPLRKIYVGNVNYEVTEYQLIKLFQEHGTVVRAQYMFHKGGARSGEPRGIMYVEYETEEEATVAKQAMHGRLCMGRELVVRTVDEKIDQEQLLGASEDRADVDALAQKSLAQKRAEAGG